MSAVFHFTPGRLPLLVSMPHVGTHIPDDIAQQLNPVAQVKADTDWHLPLLYNMLQELGVSVLQATHSRYVIDLNRPADDLNLYPGQDTTGLCPVDTFDKQALYPEGGAPNAAEIARRVAAYWQPYHQQLQTELARIRALHGIAICWDAHSIVSHVPRFFEGRLPDLNFGTADGRSCAPSLQTALQQTLLQSDQAQAFSHVFNGRFKGGYITRNYGQVDQHIHAVQLEMSQCIYMNETAPFDYRPDLAAQIQPVLRQLLATCLSWANSANSATQQGGI